MSGLLQLTDVGVFQPPEDVEIYRERIADLLGRKTKSFPGAQPVSFSKRHLQELQHKDYYVCEKTDGIRCLLYLTWFMDEGREHEANFLIDRRNDFYHVNSPHFHFPKPDKPLDSFHTETLLDGELVLDTMPNGQQIPRYLVFDCLALDGQTLLHRTLDKRLAYFVANVLEPYNNLFATYPEEKEEQPFEVMVKKMEKAYGIQMMFVEVLPKLPHGNDGLVFTCRTSEYVIGTDKNIIKWKPPHENTIDFRLRLGLFPGQSEDAMDVDGADDEADYDACPSFSLLVFKGSGRSEFFAPLHVTDDEWQSMKSVNQQLDGRIIECYKDDHQRWRFKREKDGTPRFRDDKTEANHISTVESVLESIEDAVSEQDLLDHAKAINVAWKEREKREHEAMKLKQEEEMRRRKAAEAQRQQSLPKA